MKLNGLYELYDCTVSGDTVMFYAQCTMSEAMALQGGDFTVSNEESDIAVYSGYTITRIERDQASFEDNKTFIFATRKLEDSTAEVIGGLEKSVSLLISAEKRNEAFQDGIGLKVDELNQNAMSNAEEFAQYKSAVPSMLMRADLTDAEALSCSGMYPEWTIGFDYKKDWIISFENQLYRIGQDHTSQEQWKPGETGTESLYSAISFSGEYEVWKEWDGISGSYAINQIVKDPNDGKLYKSKVPNNVWGPPNTQPDYWEEYTA